MKKHKSFWSGFANAISLYPDIESPKVSPAKELMKNCWNSAGKSLFVGIRKYDEKGSRKAG